MQNLSMNHFENMVIRMRVRACVRAYTSTYLSRF